MHSTLPAKRIMIVGDWKMLQYESALAHGFEALGWTVYPFRIRDHIGSDIPSRVEKKLLFGPKMDRCNEALLDTIGCEKPDVILLYKPIYLFSCTIAKIRQISDATLVSQCNDNPYEDGERFRLWRHYHKNIQLCDLNFFSRPSDCEYAARENVPNPRWLKFYYVDGFHRPVERVASAYKNDVVFIGHYEADGRDAVLEYLLENGIKLRVFGPEWKRAPRRKLIGQQLIQPVFGEDYVRYLSAAKIALVFLSHRNKDQYTCRCFEIPACRTLMIAPRTEVLGELYKENEEAVFFDGKQELLEKIRLYLADDAGRRYIAEAGYRRCMADGHTNIDRAAEIIRSIEKLHTERPDALNAAAARL
jgi:spore maturation protein CgeB